MVPVGLRAAGRAAADAQRQGGPQGAARARTPRTPAARRAYVAPRDASWSSRSRRSGREVLRRASAWASHDNFFDLGGHSLLLVQVHARLRGGSSGVDVPLRRTCSSTPPSRRWPRACRGGAAPEARPGARRARAASRRQRRARAPGAPRTDDAMSDARPRRRSPSSAWPAASRAPATVEALLAQPARRRGVDRASSRDEELAGRRRAARPCSRDPATCARAASLDGVEQFDAALLRLHARARRELHGPAAAPLPRVRLGGAGGRRLRPARGRGARSASSPARAPARYLLQPAARSRS